MPRPRKPTILHAVEGTLRKRHADRWAEPISTEPVGDPPGSWRKEDVSLWREIVDQIPPGVATIADRQIVELLVRLIGRARADPDSLSPAMASQIRLTLGEIGLTPSARSRVQVLPAPSDNPADRYFR